MESIEDLFDVELTDEEAESVVDDVLTGVSVPGKVIDTLCQPSGDAFSVCVLTVPDVDRFPLPERFAVNKTPVDLAGIAHLSGGELRKLIQPSLPEEQLLQIEAAERVREKPRQMVLSAVHTEKLARDMACDCCGHRPSSFADWIESHARNPLTCRIAAIAWQDGEDGELVAIAPASLEEEAAALADLRVRWSQFSNSAGQFAKLSAGEINQVMWTITVRRMFLGMQCEPGDFSPAFVQHSEWLRFAKMAGGITGMAKAIGLADHEIPPVLSDLAVYQQYRSQPGSVGLVDAVAAQLQLERSLIQAMSVLW